MRTPLRELLRSLRRGESPRADRRVADAVAWGADVSCTGKVLSVDDAPDGLLCVVMDGEWSVADLDENGMPLSVQVDHCVAEIVLEAQWRETVTPGRCVSAVSTITLADGFSSRVS
jgi:hypothetical protein